MLFERQHCLIKNKCRTKGHLVCIRTDGAFNTNQKMIAYKVTQEIFDRNHLLRIRYEYFSYHTGNGISLHFAKIFSKTNWFLYQEGLSMLIVLKFRSL